MKVKDLFVKEITAKYFIIVTEKENSLLLEFVQQRIPKTNRVAIFHPGKTSTKTQDHFEIYADKKLNNKLYAINRDGSSHDGYKAQLNKKDIEFLRSQEFNPPEDGILETIVLNREKQYVYILIESESQQGLN